MLSLYIKKKYKKVLDEARRKSYSRGHKDGARVAGKEFQKITKEAEKQNKKKLDN